MLAAILKQNHSQCPHSDCFFNVCAHLSLKYSIFLLSLSGCPILSMMGGSFLESSGDLGVLPSSQGGLFEPGGSSQKYFRNDFIHCIQSTKMTVSREFLGVHHWQSGPEYYFSCIESCFLCSCCHVGPTLVSCVCHEFTCLLGKVRGIYMRPYIHSTRSSDIICDYGVWVCALVGYRRITASASISSSSSMWRACSMISKFSLLTR